MKNIYLFVFTILCGLFSVTSAETLVVESKSKMPPPQLGIAPPRIEETVKSKSSGVINQSVIFYNYSPKPKTINLSLVDTNKQHRPIKPNKKTLLPWTILNPTTFTIPGNGQQTIRLSIRPPKGFPRKTHYAVLHIEQHVSEPLKMDADGKGATVTLGASYAMPLVIHVK